MFGELWSAMQAFFASALISISDYSFVIVVLILAASAAMLIGWASRLAFIYSKRLYQLTLLWVSLAWRRSWRGNKMSRLEKELVHRLQREQVKYRFKCQFMADRIVDNLEDMYFEGRVNHEVKQEIYRVLAEGFDIPDLMPRNQMRLKARIRARLKALGLRKKEDLSSVVPVALPDRMHGCRQDVGLHPAGAATAPAPPPKNRLAALFTRTAKAA